MILQEAQLPFNGSGTFTLAEAAFVPNTPISSSAVNSDLSDIATNGLTNVVTKDGQTTITGAFKGASGSVGLPMYSFSADTDSGMYRIGANNIGLSVNATKILDIATTGLGVTGTVSPTTTVTNAVGTVLLPSYTFVGDLNSGFYWIGADNIGAAVNGAKVLDISTSGLNVIGTVSSNGTAFAPLPQSVGMVNGTIVETHGSSAATYAIKTLAGADPSATDIVYLVFRNVTPGTGNYTVLQLTSALSLTITNGSTLGTSNTVPFKLWLVIFNDAGTARLGVINTVSGSNIYPLGQFPIASSTAEGGSGGADSAQVFYTGTAITSKAYFPIGYASYESGMATAGAWTASPTRLQLFGNGVPLPGQAVQELMTTNGTHDSTTNNYSPSATPPAPGGGKSAVAQAITPTSAANILDWTAQAVVLAGTGQYSTSFLYDTTNTTTRDMGTAFSASGQYGQKFPLRYRALSSTTSALTYTVYFSGSTGTTYLNGYSGTQYNPSNTYISVREIMT